MADFVYQYEDDPIIVVNFQNIGPDTDAQALVMQAAKRFKELAAGMTGQIYRILVFDEAINFSQMMRGMAADTIDAGFGESDTSITLMVGTSEIVDMAASALSQEQYGGLDVPHFETLDAAVNYIREQ